MSTILRERHDHVLLITFNREDKLNAFDPDMIAELADAYTELAEDKTLRCGVIAARGRFFTSGLDLMAVAPRMMPGAEPLIAVGKIDPWGVNTPPCPKPIVSAVQGRCFTLGIELMLAAQINVAAEGASFCQAEVSRGILPFGGGSVRWAQAVGAQNAYRYLLTGDNFDAAEALRMGLVQQVVAAEQCLETAMTLAQRVATQAPLAVQATLRNARLAQDQGPAAAFAKLHPELLALMSSQDARIGMEAFMLRKPAEFIGE